MQLFPLSGWRGQKLRAFCCLHPSILSPGPWAGMLPLGSPHPPCSSRLAKRRLQPLLGKGFPLNSPSLPIDLSDQRPLVCESPSDRVQPGSAASEIRESSRRGQRMSADRIAFDTVFCHIFSTPLLPTLFDELEKFGEKPQTNTKMA